MNRLKELRKEKKLTQEEIALELQVSPRTYQRWENGESQIKPDKAQALAEYLGVSVGYLLGYESNCNTQKMLREILEICLQHANPFEDQTMVDDFHRIHALAEGILDEKIYEI